MAPCATSINTTRLGRVVHWLFPTPHVIVAVAAVEVSVFLFGSPLPVHIVVGLVLHVALSLLHSAVQ